MSDIFGPQGGDSSDLPPWLAQLLASRMSGGQPTGPLAANPANLPASPNMANMSVVGLPSSSGFTLPNGTPAPVAADASLVRGGVSQGAHAAPPPPQSQPMAAANVKQQQPQQKPPPVKPAPPTAYARPGGEYQVGDPRNPNPSAPAGTTAPPGLTSYVDDSLFADRSPDSTTSQGGGYAAPAAATPAGQGGIGSDARFPVGPAIPGAPSNGAVPNLGYYRPTMGNAQGNPTWVPQGATGSPQMFRGPLALPGSQNYYGQPAAAAGAAAAPAPPPPPPPAAAAAPAGAGPGPIAPGVGTQWLRKMWPGVFGGGGQPTA